MNLVQDLFTSRTLNRWLPRVAVVVLLAGVIVYVAVRWSNTATPLDTPVSSKPAVVPGPPPRETKLSAGARQVAAEFIHTAVARKNLAAAWAITGESIKAGTSYKQWLSGNIAVVPYPAAPDAGLSIQYSHRNDADLLFALTPQKGIKMKPQFFEMMLNRVGPPGKKHWLVTYWAPYSHPQVPYQGN
ncbi:MAG TPA: hypothetical protein VF002_08110 [Gaiellaceae bacterium]